MLLEPNVTKQDRKPKICIVTTEDSSLYVLYPAFFPLLLEKGFEVVGICADGPWVEDVKKQGIKVIIVPMTRGFTPWQDLKCLWKLYRIFKRERFDLIHYSTPKAALLSGVAGRLAHCPALMYTLRGLGYMAFGGLKRKLGKLCEKIACSCADYVIAISNSLKNEAVKEAILSADRITVLGAGSSKGVNLDQFRLNEMTRAEAKKIRQDLNIDADSIVIGYVGRLTKEKGIVELANALTALRKVYPGLQLLLIGYTDQRSPLSQVTFELLHACEYIHIIPFQDNLPGYLAAMDILVLPSYREGFGNALIEASAMQVPVVATDITGCRDAVMDGKTGLLVKPQDTTSLVKALNELIEDRDKRIKFGKNGERWVRENFDRRIIWNKLLGVYNQMLSNLNRP
jgi:glycosyltransferase involved in cell wall biosynthesis